MNILKSLNEATDSSFIFNEKKVFEKAKYLQKYKLLMAAEMSCRN